MKNIVIAAGYATRLGELTKNFPKPLLQIGQNTILGRMLDDIDRIPEIDEHIIITNGRFASIFQFWAEKQHYTKPITVVDDGTLTNETRLGAVCDLLFAMDKLHLEDDLLVVAADNLLFFSFQEFVDFAYAKGTSCIMCHEQPSVEKLQRTGVIVVDQDMKVLNMEEKPKVPKSTWAVPPFYIYLKKDLDLVRHSVENGCGKDAPGNLAHYMVEHTTMHAWPMSAGRFDIGSLDTYYEAVEKYGSERLQFTVSTHGAELQSLRKNGREYLWHGDPAYWGRRSPILFPMVGKVYGGIFRVNGKEYPMGQHGFARDKEFRKVGERYVLSDGPLENYPYQFELAVTYRTEGNRFIARWTVTNRDSREMHFQIGAHPALLLPDYNPADAVHGYLQCRDAEGKVVEQPMLSHGLDGGCLTELDAPVPMPMEDGLLPITGETFSIDTFMIEQGKVKSVTLLDKDKKPYLTVGSSQTQAYGIWAPYKPGCPFVCLEPWCGITDTVGFAGDISERYLNHSLQPGETFVFEYWIEIA